VFVDGAHAAWVPLPPGLMRTLLLLLRLLPDLDC